MQYNIVIDYCRGGGEMRHAETHINILLSIGRKKTRFGVIMCDKMLRLLKF